MHSQLLKQYETELIHELWMRGDLEFLLWPQQVPIWNAIKAIPEDVSEFVNLCGRQFGKSTIGVIDALSEAIKNRDCCILIMGPDIKQTKDIVRPKMRFLTRTAPKGLIVQQKAENRWHIYHDLDKKASDYTEIVLGGFNENSSSQRGKTVHRIIIEEVVDVHEDHFLESLEHDLGPAMLHSKQGKMIFNTTLPKYPGHPFITQTMVKAKLDNAIAIYTIEDNIALSPKQKALAIKRAGGIHSDSYRREYMCEVVRDRSQVCLPDFETSRDVEAFELPQYWFPQIAIDWGGVRDKTCAVLYTYDYLQNRVLFIDERVFPPNTPTSVIVKGVREMEDHIPNEGTQRPIKSRWIDAPPQLVHVDLYQEYKYHASVPLKQDWEATLNGLNVAFSTNHARIHPRCKFLILSAESGILNKNKNDYERTETLGHMDGIAAMKYGNRMIDKSNPYPIWMPSPIETPSLPAIHHAIMGTQPPKEQARIPLSFAGSEYHTPRGFGKHRKR